MSYTRKPSIIQLQKGELEKTKLTKNLSNLFLIFFERVKICVAQLEALANRIAKTDRSNSLVLHNNKEIYQSLT